MAETHKHTLLIVDDDKTLKKSMNRLLENLGIKTVYAPSCETGIQMIQNASKPFSIVFSRLRMPGMNGHEFFKHVFEISPDSQRYLMTRFEDMNEVIEAINQGRIHRIFKRPWNDDELYAAVEKSLNCFELLQEEKSLFNQVKMQNKQLYELKKELSGHIGFYKKKMAELNSQIDGLTSKLKNRKSGPEQTKDKKIERIIAQALNTKIPDQNSLNSLYCYTLNELYEQLIGIKTMANIEFPDVELWR